MSLVIYSVIDKAPIIFLRLAERSNGEVDAYISPPHVTINTYAGIRLLPSRTFNYSKIVNQFPTKILTPRSHMFGLLNADKVEKKIINYWSDFKHKLMFIDTEIERKHGIGKQYKHRKLQSHECLVSDILMHKHNFKIGQKVAFDAPYVVHLKLFIHDFLENDEDKDKEEDKEKEKEKEDPKLMDLFYTQLKVY
jgi:hypothetical protein